MLRRGATTPVTKLRVTKKNLMENPKTLSDLGMESVVVLSTTKSTSGDI